MLKRIIIICSAIVLYSSCNQSTNSDLEDFNLAKFLIVFDYGDYNMNGNCISLYEDITYKASDSLSSFCERSKKYNFTYINVGYKMQGYLIICMIDDVLVQCEWSTGNTMVSYFGRKLFPFYPIPDVYKLTMKEESIFIRKNKAIFKELNQNIRWCDGEKIDPYIKEEWFLINVWYEEYRYKTLVD